MMTQKRNNLGFLGEAFQYQLVHEFMSNHTFFEDLSPIVDQNMFTDPNLRVFVGVMKNYYERNGNVPNAEMMDIELRNLSHSDKEIETYCAVLDKILSSPSVGGDRIQELAQKFFRQQNIVKAANEILKIAGDGNTNRYDEVIGLLNDALTKGTHNDFGECVFDHLNETLSDDYRIPIPTGIDKIDKTLEGGLGKGELGVIIGPSGFGKAQPLTSLIVTPSGYKKMGDMNVGDSVIGRDGKAYKVTGVFPQGKRPIYEVSFSNGTSCECDIEHLWNVNTLYQRRGKKYIKGVSKSRDDKFYKPDETYKTMTLKEIIDKGLYRGSKKKLNFKVPINEKVEFLHKDVKNNPYLVGYYIGDGCYSRGVITVGANDKESIENELKPTLSDSLHMFFREKRNVWQFSVIGNAREKLNEEFDKNIKSDGKYIPDDYIFNSVDVRIALLQGLMDSDGHANKNGSCEFSSKSKKLAEQVQFIVRSLGGFASLIESESSYISQKTKERIHCGKRYRVTISMCDESIKLFRLKRKQNRVKYRTQKNKAVFITNVQYVRDDYAQCIMVDSDEHLYLTNDFIVTHNTSLTTAMASYAATYRCQQNNYEGFKVLQIVFEDRIKQIQRKHIGRITNIESKDLSKPDNIDIVREKIKEFADSEMLQNNLRIVKFASGEKTARDIKRFIEKLTNNGFKPDLVIVDYFECLAHEPNRDSTNEFEKEGKTMRIFEAMVGELDIAMWIPSQGTKDSINLELVTMDKIGGSVKKAQIAHIILSIARTVDDIANSKATIAVLKNRAGASGKVFDNVDFNNGTCRISTDNVDEMDSLFEAKEKAQNDNFKLQQKIMNSSKE